MPGASRHHWGTDIDFNSLNNEWFESGQGKKLFDWLESHASAFGFCRPYTEDRTTGYNSEKWHWSYLPVSKKLTQYAKDNFNNNLIQDFDGAETVEQIDILGHYILGINPKCKD